MANILRKWARRVGGRRQKTDRVPACFEAGRRLLAKYDCHDSQVSVVRITKEAKVSLGTFYARFQSKDGFIFSLNFSTFRVLLERAAETLNDEHFDEASVETILRGIARRVASDLGNGETAGVIRAALKLAPNMPDIAQPLREYRALVMKRARALLAKHHQDKISSDRIDGAMQMLFGTIIDTIIEKPGPLKLGSDEMEEALGDMLTGYIAIFPKRGRAKIKARSRKDQSNGDKHRPKNQFEGRHELPLDVASIVALETGKITDAMRIAPKPRKRLRRKTPAAERKTATAKPTSFQLPQNDPDKTDRSAHNKRKRRIRVV